MLPQHLCASCELTVNTIYCKISNFYKFEQQLMADLKSANPSHPYLRAIEIVQVRVGYTRRLYNFYIMFLFLFYFCRIPRIKLNQQLMKFYRNAVTAQPDFPSIITSVAPVPF